MKILKRLMLYQHFDCDNIIDDYVLFQLQTYHGYGIDIIFLTNSDLAVEEQQKVLPLTKGIVLHGNSGFDFGAWRSWLLQNGQEQLKNYDRLILANCSCYGPLFPMDNLLEEMDFSECDFWGITSFQPYKEFTYPEHVQSYFLSLAPQVFQSEAFWKYWKSNKDYSTFELAVKNGEYAFSQALITAGFQYRATHDIPEKKIIKSINFVPSFSYTTPEYLIARYRLPLVKVKGFSADEKVPVCKGGAIIHAIRESGSDYPIQLIYNHLRRTKPLSWHKNLPGTLFISREKDPILPLPENFKLAVLAHFFYPDLFDEVLEYLKNIPYSFDFLISTSSDENAESLRSKIAASGLNVLKLDIRVVPNRGRDVAPWIFSFKDVQFNYDLILKLHSKKSKEVAEVIPFSWAKHIYDSILGSPAQVSNIVEQFVKDEKLGTVIPPYPAILHLSAPHSYIGHCPDLTQELIQRCSGKVPPKETTQPMFGAGTMFWYRPEAARKIFESDISLDEFPEEPFPTDGTIAHAMERAIPYIMNCAGYHYKISASEDGLIHNFQWYEDRLMTTYWDDKEELIYFLKETIQDYEHSFCWKITKPIRILSGFVKKLLGKQ